MLSPEAVAGSARLSVFQREGATVSASRLEKYATCPYQYFMHYTLNVDPVEEPEDIERIDNMQRGSLIHEILQKFLVELGPDDPPRAEARERHLQTLMRIAREEGDERVRRGVTGRPLIWRMDKKAIDEDLIRWYDHDARYATETGMAPGAFEARFGPPGYGFGDEDPHLSSDDPLEIAVDGRTIRLQGRIDRIDWTPDRQRFRVIDYKTGRVRPGRDERLKGGASLQLPIYLRAAARMLGVPEDRGEAQYFFATSRGGFKRHTLTGDELIGLNEDFERILRTIAGGVDAGYFAPKPDKQKHCRYCDYNTICDAQIDRIMKAKTFDDRAQAFIELGEIS
jgi:ATP-dependent helicase/DNAse subunit B